MLYILLFLNNLVRLIVYKLIQKTNGLDKKSLDKGLSKLMEIVGYGVQIGSFCGAVIFFLLVNVAHIFEEQY